MYNLDHAFANTVRDEVRRQLRTENVEFDEDDEIYVACANGCRQEDAIQMTVWVDGYDKEFNVFIPFSRNGHIFVLDS